MPLVISGNGEVVTNSVTLEDSPAVWITGNGVHFTNTEAGRIRSTSSTAPAIRIDGADSVIVNAFGGVIRGTGFDTPAIIGSAFDDTIVNDGLIVGTIRLGEGSDSMTQRAGGSGSLIDFGGGDDVYRFEHSGSFYVQTATGGAGFDRMVLEGALLQIDGMYTSGFERLEIGAGPINVQNFSGYSEVALAAGASVNMLFSANPDADLELAGAGVTVNKDSAFRNVLGSDGTDAINVIATVFGAINLGGGGDYFHLTWLGEAAPHVGGPVDGGDGNDLIGLNAGDGQTVSFTQFTNFETLSIQPSTNSGGNVRVTNATGLTQIWMGPGAVFALAASVPDATVRMGYPSTFTLEAGSIVRRVGLFEDDGFTHPGTFTQADDSRSSTFINNGIVRDEIRFNNGDDLYDGRLGIALGPVFGYAGNDRLYGGAFADRLDGGLGSDRLEGGGGDDTLTGGGGNDTFYVDAADQIVEAAGGGSDYVIVQASFMLNAGAEVELFSTASNDGLAGISLTGNEYGQVLVGNAGGNHLDGGGGADLLVGLAGNDTYIVDSNDRVAEANGGGSDYVAAKASFVLEAGPSVELISTTDNNGTAAINLTGNEFSQVLVGNAGANSLNGGSGADLLAGLGGNDTYIVDADDRAVEAANGGSDYVIARSSFILESGSEVELLSTADNGGTEAISLTGNETHQVLVGNAGANYLDGGSGADLLVGLGGNDVYFVDHDDRVVEGAGGGSDYVVARTSFVLEAGASVELLSTTDNGGGAAIGLTGNELAQSLIGNAGTNMLNGLGGADFLLGLGGTDSFAFTSALGGGNVDVIGDFSAADDTILIDNAVFTTLGAAGALNPNAFVIGPAATSAAHRIVYDGATGNLFYDADGSGAGAAMLFATLSGAPVISASDFVVI